MKKVLGFILIVAFLISCSREKRVVEESYPDGKPKKVCIYTGRGKNREKIRETDYYSNGNMKLDGTYKDGKRDGQWTYWYENGTKWSEGFFRDGKNDGKRLTYFPNGKLRYEAYYKEGGRTGKWKFFDETGRMLQEINYQGTPPDTIKK
jgi:antitoxin component YwqK of YwqJK toxin-antitoxin module